MVTITIDGKQISVDENLSILEAAQEADVKIPTLCYLKDVNEVGACKMCVVEVEGSRHLVTSCNTKVKEGVEYYWSTVNQPIGFDLRFCRLPFVLFKGYL